MKKYLLIAVTLIFTTCIFAQKATDILQRSYNKCQTVRNGYYEMSKYMKYMDKEDTFKTTYKCSFKKRNDDTIHGKLFNNSATYSDGTEHIAIYTGDEFIDLNPADSTAIIMTISSQAEDVRSRLTNNTFYSPLTSKKSSHLYHDSDFLDNKHEFKLIGSEKLNGKNCYHIQVNETEDWDSADVMHTIRCEFHFWINKKDFIPVQYTIAYDMAMQNDTQYQYEKFVLSKYSLDKLKDESVFTLNAIPAYYKKKDYVPYKSPKLLPIDAIAPEWELVSLSDEKISLEALKGKLVLLDFFYKSCYPCMQALPVLQSLHMKYKDSGLHIVGVDPYDKKEDAFVKFLSKRGVTYPVVTDARTVATDYHVSGYPTIYLIDRTGKIIYTQVGYGKDTEKELEEIIRRNLH